MQRDFHIFKHTVRVVTTDTDYGSGLYRPGVRFFLTGPNGSPNGSGPKAWPLHMRIRNFRSTHAWAKTGWAKRHNGQYGWTNCIYVPLPHLKWGSCYRFRRFGALRVERWIERFWKAIL